MSDVVPPGGDQPVDDVPWPVAARPVAPGQVRLPSAPVAVPADVQAPTDWRTMDDGGALFPPGYRTASGRAVHSTTRLDRLGLTASIIGVTGVIQIMFVAAPILALLAVTLGLSGRRANQLDPEGVRLPLLSTIGLSLGVAGCMVGLAMALSEYA
ncbi:MAG: hypothetical protein ABIR32_10445 [Ilumatobacteraceae bacterium]